MQVQQALVGSKVEAVLACMYVCMYVRNGFTIEIYQYVDLCTVYIFFWHVPLMMPSQWR